MKKEYTEDKAGLRGGFSLVEVCLAIFIVSIGLLTLFTLFPKGLKQAELGHTDTQTALFADYVLSTLCANAMGVDSDVWFDVANPLNLSDIWDGPFPLTEAGSPSSVEFPTDSPLHVRYMIDLEVDPNSNNSRYTVALWVQAGQYGSSDETIFKTSAEAYYTELFFMGMP